MSQASSTTEILLNKARAALEREPRIVAAFVFGSVANATMTNESDVDIAIIATPPLASGQLLNLVGELTVQLGRDIDLVQITPDLSLLLRNEIATSGKMLFTRDTAKSDQFMIKTPQMYEDFMVTRRPLEEAYRQRKLRE